MGKGFIPASGGLKMNFSELKDLFYSYSNVSTSDVTDVELAGWFNEAADDLAYDLGPVSSHTYEDAETEIALTIPSDALELFTDEYDLYTINLEGKLVPSATGDLTIYYRKIPYVYVTENNDTTLTNHGFTGTDDTEESELHKALHILLVLFACSRYWDSESEGDGEEMELATKWMQYYLQGKQKAISKLSVVNNGTKVDHWTVIY